MEMVYLWLVSDDHVHASCTHLMLMQPGGITLGLGVGAARHNKNTEENNYNQFLQLQHVLLFVVCL